jgi:hypothetical protein
MDTMTRFGLAALLVVLTAGLSGCSAGDYRALVHSDVRQAVLVGGDAWDATSALALDIENSGGSVRVKVDPRLVAPVVEARTRWKAGEPEVWTDDDPPSSVDAVYAAGPEGRAVLVVRAEASGGGPAEASIDVDIVVPSCEGIAVKNGWGPVQLVGVTGAITVENGVGMVGAGEMGAGRVEVRTGAPIVDPVALTTTRGPITLVTEPRGRGTIEMLTGDGVTHFRTRYGTLREVRPEPGVWRGVWNGGTNPVHLRTGAGRTRVMVQQDPVGFTIAESRRDAFTK